MTAPARRLGVDLNGIGTDLTHPPLLEEQEQAAIRLVRQRCTRDADVVLAALGLDLRVRS